MDSIDVQTLAGEFLRRVEALPERKVPFIRPIRRDISKRISRAEPAQVLDLARRIIDLGSREWAYEIVYYHRPTSRSLDVEVLEILGQGIDSWSALDTFGGQLAGPAWQQGQISNAVVHGWAESDDRWWRRAALVATTGLNVKARGGTGDKDRTLAVCRMLAGDHDDMVAKAMSWALRELVPWDPDSVESFLREHDDVLAARVKREVRNKLDTGLKNPRKAGS